MRVVLAYLSQSGLRGALAGLLVGGLLGMVGVAAALAGRPTLRPEAPILLGAGSAVGGLFLGLVGGSLGGLIGLGLALRRRRIPPARLSGLFLTAAVAVLPPGGVLSAGWLTLTRGWGQPRVVAAALLAVLAGGLLAVRLRRPIDRLIVALGPWEGRLVWGGVPGLALAMAGALGLAALGPPLAVTGSPPAAGQPVRAGEQGLAAARPAVAAERPSVLLITVDTLRADHLSSYGARPGQTPTLDRLAAEGARFVWAFAQQPNTNGQHASLFTGTYPATHGVRVHMVDRLPADLPTLAEVLQAAGYATAGIYSWISLEPAFSGWSAASRSTRDTC